MERVWKFLMAFAREPGRVGAVVPSSAFLARRMVQAADIRAGHTVVELGAGTGSITRFIREAAPDAALLALEPDAALASALRCDLPDVAVVERLAHELPEILAEWGHDRVDRVVSSLPWAIWPAWVQESIFDAILEALAEEGRMVTFSYVHSQVVPQGIRLKKALHERFDRVDRTRVQWKNLPPAFVWVCSEPRRGGVAAA